MEHVDNTDFDIKIHPWLTPEKRANGETWRKLFSINPEEAQLIADDITKQLKNLIYRDRGTYKEKKLLFAALCKDDKTLILFDKGEEKTENAKEYLKEFCVTAIATGCLFVDTEGSDMEMWKSMGCKQENTLYHVSLVQFGVLTGQRILVRTLYNCRGAHKMGERMTEEEHEDSFRVNGVPIPDCLVQLLTDPWIYKVQSNITGPANAPGDAQKLGRMLGVKVQALVELQNLFFLRYGQTKKCGIDALCKKLGLDPGSDVLFEEHKRRSWTMPRGREKKRWSARMFYYDLIDVLAPAIFCLKLACEIHAVEPAAHPEGSVIEHLRLVFHLLRDEPSFTRSGSLRPHPWHIEKPFVEYTNDDLYTDNGEDKGQRAVFPFVWRPGMYVGKTNYGLGPYPVRNVRQLAGLVLDDAYKIGGGLIREDWLPKDKREPVDIAKQVHAFRNPVTAPKAEAFIRGPSYDKSDRYRTVRVLHEKKERKRLGYKTPGPYEKEAGPSRYLGKRKSKDAEGPSPKKAKKKKNKKSEEDYTCVRHPFPYGRCTRCGDDVCDGKGHTATNCKEPVRCKYQLCTSDKRGHSTLVCFDIMQKCPACGLRGHPPVAHRFHSIVMLIAVFNAWAPFNVLTSLPYLDGTGHHRVPTNNEFRFMFHSRAKGLGLYDKL